MHTWQPIPIGSIILERYLVQGLLGTGNFGAAYLVKDQYVKYSLFALEELIIPSKEERRRITEGALLTELYHPALPRVFEVFCDDEHDRVYLLMEYIEGPNLELLRLWQPQKIFLLPQVMSIMTPIIHSVSYLHAHRPPLIHCGIKPTNIIMSKARGKAVLINFGLLKKYGMEAPPTIGRGSLGYEAPEQYAGEINTRSDIYGLGATFYSLLTGFVPASALYRMIQLQETGCDPLIPANQVIPSVPATRAEATYRAIAFHRMTQTGDEGSDPLMLVNQVTQNVPTAIARTIQRAMSINSAERFSTVEEFWQTLNTYAKDIQGPIPEIVLSTSPKLPALSLTAPRQPAVSSTALRQAVVEHRIEVGLSTLSMPKRERVLAPINFRTLSYILLTLVITLGIGVALWSYIVGYNGTGSSAMTSVMMHLHNAATQTQTHAVRSTVVPTNTPLPATSGTIVGAYDGTIFNLAINAHSAMSLMEVRNNLGNISGYYAGFQLIGTFSGTIDTARHIQFRVISYTIATTFAFDGEMQVDGNLAGTYCSLNQQGKCAGDYGLWSVSPAA